MGFMIVKITDDRNKKPALKAGVYSVTKVNTLAYFSFGKPTSSFKDIDQAHKALHIYLAKRKDRELLVVSLFNNHV